MPPPPPSDAEARLLHADDVGQREVAPVIVDGVGHAVRRAGRGPRVELGAQQRKRIRHPQVVVVQERDEPCDAGEMDASPAFLAAAMPRLCACVTTRMRPSAVASPAATPAVPSREPSSTMTSSQPANVCARMLATVAARNRPPWVGTTIEISGAGGVTRGVRRSPRTRTRPAATPPCRTGTPAAAAAAPTSRRPSPPAPPAPRPAR